jgi:hypothetical protein
MTPRVAKLFSLWRTVWNENPWKLFLGSGRSAGSFLSLFLLKDVRVGELRLPGELSRCPGVRVSRGEAYGRPESEVR